MYSRGWNVQPLNCPLIGLMDKTERREDMTRTMKLFDDGTLTYQALRKFTWDGVTTETPFGTAAYVGEGDPEPAATCREPHPFFGVANGREWAQPFPITVQDDPNSAKYGINRQDIITVHDNLGGGYVSFGRHDCPPASRCLFGSVYLRRISIMEANRAGLHTSPDASWYDEYSD